MENQGKRLNKFIADSGYCSRREADRLIEEGRVKVDGRIGVLGDKILPGMAVLVDDQALSGRGDKVYILLNKPRGVVCTADPREPMNVVDYLNYPIRVFPVGRLDKDSEGLLLLTNDGALTHRLLHPSHEVSKEYRVTVSGPVEHAAERLSRIRDVVGLPIRPAEVRELSRKGNRAELSVIIHEGRNRQIRRMCAQCELEVLRLQRVREHCLELGTLPLGQWRYLTAEEITGLKEE